MTCIIGLEHNSKVYIGGDSAAINNVAIYETNIRKVFQAGPFLFGWTQSFRMGQILQYHLRVEKQTTEQDDMQYMVVTFIEAVHDCLKEYRFDKDKEDDGPVFLVGYNGHLYTIYQDYQVQHFARGINAVGSGTEFALGAMSAYKDMPPVKRIKRALNIAGQWSESVCGPYYVKEQTNA